MKKLQKKLSIIIPVYNGSLTIRRCVDSVLSQTIAIDDVEILLINDGSRDGSDTILKEYADRYPNSIRYINQENIGAARTRNKGIDFARGEFVQFLDQDDYIEEDYCQVFYTAAIEGEYDIVRGGYNLVNEQNKVLKKKFPVDTEFGKFLTVPAWAKIHRTKFLKKTGISFFENNIGEDNVFNVREILLTDKWKAIQYAGYNNSFDNKNNVTNSLHKGLSEQVRIIQLLDELFTLQSSDKLLNEYLQYNIVRTIVYYLLSYGRYATPERFTRVYTDLFNWLNDNIPNFKTNRYVRFMTPRGESLAAQVGIKVFVLLHRVHLVEHFAKVYCRR